MAGERVLEEIKFALEQLVQRVGNLEKDRDKLYHLTAGIALAWGALTYVNQAGNRELMERILGAREARHSEATPVGPLKTLRPATEAPWIAGPAAAAEAGKEHHK